MMIQGLKASRVQTTGETRKVQSCMRARGALLSLSNKVRDISDEYAVLLRMDRNDSAVVGLRVDEFPKQNTGLAHDDILSHGQLLCVPPPMHPLTPCPSSKGAIGPIKLVSCDFVLQNCGILLVNVQGIAVRNKTVR